MKRHCCEDMDYHVNLKCEVHENPFTCPDNLVIYNEKYNDYGLIIHDGGSSTIQIDYCPWCGSKI